MKLRIALIQFWRDTTNKPKNIERMLLTLSEIKNADIVCLPEAWTSGKLEEEECRYLLSSLRQLAADNRYNLLTGGLFNRRGEKIFSTCHVINRDGRVVGFYDKHFPSAVFNEREFTASGVGSPVFEVDDVGIGVLVCVDAFYPELARKLALNGARIIFNPSNIPKNRNELWKHMSVTRAAENTVFYVFVNNTKTVYPDGRPVEGHSLVIAPDGEIILEADEGEGVFQAELDLSQIDRVRERWRYLDDIRRRPVVY